MIALLMSSFPTIVLDAAPTFLEKFQTPITAIAITIATVLFTIFTKTIITIYQQGIAFKTKFVTVEEFERLERELREEFRFYKEETTKTIMIAVNEMVKEKIKSFEDIRSIANEVHVDKETIDIKLETFNEKLKDLNEVRNAITSINNRINSLQMNRDGGTGNKRRE